VPVIRYHAADGTLVLLDVEHLPAADAELVLASARPRDRRSLERMFVEMRARELRLNAMATEAQQRIGYGDHATLRWEGSGNPLEPPPCTIYGRIYTEAEYRRRECDAAAELSRQGEEARPVEESLAHRDASHRNGWRYGWWHSAIDPGGEPGEHHVATLTPITARQFRTARRDGWPDEVPLERET